MSHLALALVLAALAPVVACGGDADPRARVEFWGLGREGEVVASMLPAFERAHPDLAVRVQQIPWSAAHEKLLTAFVGESLPDAFQLGATWVPELAALGALEPLDGWLARSSAFPRADYFAGAWAAGSVDGAAFAVPWYVDTRVLFYRRDLLARAGVEGPPATFAAWLDAMQRVQRAAAPGRHAMLVPLAEWEPLVVIAFSLGAELLRDGDRFANFRSPAFRQAFTWYLALFERGLASRAGAGATASVYRDFADGWFCFYLTGPWNLGEFARRLPPALADAWATAPVPGRDAGHPGVSIAGGGALAVSSRSPRKAAALRFLAWLSAPEQQLELHRRSGDLPSRRSAWAARSLAGDPRAAAFRAQLEHVRTPPRIPEWERVAARITRYAELAVRGELAPDDALAALDADVDGLLAKRRWLLEHAARPADPER